MDVAYDHVQGESFSPTDETNNPIPTDNETPSTSTTPTPSTSTQLPSQTLNAEFQEAFKAVSSSPWGTTIGGWWSQARRQGENLYQDLQKEASDAQQQASKGFSSLRSQVASHTRGISLNPAEPGPLAVVPGEEPLPGKESTGAGEGTGEGNYKGKGKEKAVDPPGAPESLPADIVKEAGTLVASLRVTAASRLKELQRAEDAADEALLKFGLNVRNFLRDAVTVTAPDDGKGAKSEVLFETQEPGTGKKVFHSSRLDAQLHAIHSTPASFTQNPAESESWELWEKEFDAETMTEAIARDLERFEELRRAMEKLVPEKVEYRVFWMRYYFLRKAIEEEEKRRKEVLRGAASDPQEEVSWDDDEDEDQDKQQQQNTAVTTNKSASESTTTLTAPATAAAAATLKPTSPRRSHEDENKSVADSDASYDIVSGATSRAPGSPKDEKRNAKDEESEDDWE